MLVCFIIVIYKDICVGIIFHRTTLKTIVSSAIKKLFATCCGIQKRMYITLLHKGSPRGWA